jgi:hypothetical protein
MTDPIRLSVTTIRLGGFHELTPPSFARGFQSFLFQPLRDGRGTERRKAKAAVPWALARARLNQTPRVTFIIFARPALPTIYDGDISRKKEQFIQLAH